MNETKLEQAERHVREGEQRLARQSALLAKLESRGYIQEATGARDLLTLLEERLQLSRERLELKRWTKESKP
jgi:hypothetical protein